MAYVKILLDNITLKYHGITAFKELTLTLPTPAVVVGAAGAGKSNLAKVICGAVIIESGRVAYDDADVSFLPPRQRETALISAATPLNRRLVKDNLLYPLKLRGIKGSDAEARLSSDLADLLPRKISGLNDCEKARVYLARALLRRPKMIIVDDPEQFLESAATKYLFSLLRQLAVPYVLFTGDGACAANLNVYTVVLKRGEVVAAGDYGHLINRPPDKYTAAMLGLNILGDGAYLPAAFNDGEQTIKAYVVDYHREGEGYMLYVKTKEGPLKINAAFKPQSRYIELRFRDNHLLAPPNQ